MLGGYTKVINIGIEGKIYFNCLFREGFNHFIGIPSFSLRVYLVHVECKSEKQLSFQIDLICGFLQRFR